MPTIKENIITNENEPCVAWKSFNGKRYLHVHFRGLDSMEYLSNMMHMKKLMEVEDDGSIRFFLDSNGADFSFNTNISLQKLSKSLQHKIHKSAFIGIKGHLVPLYKIYKSVTNSKAVLFNTEEEALNYLCSD